MNKRSIQNGFSLIELLIVVGVISLLAIVLFVNYQEARMQARDEIRIAHAEQIAVAFKLYRERYGDFPACSTGIRIEEGGLFDWHSMGTNPSGGSNEIFYNTDVTEGCVDRLQIIDFFRDYAFDDKAIPADPLGPGNIDYTYYYDGAHRCRSSSATTPLVYVTNLEVLPSNASTECPVVSGNDGGYEQTASYGGSINPSRPYVIRLSKE